MERTCALRAVKAVQAGQPSDRTARIWDTRSGRGLGILEVPHDGIDFATFSPDGKRILTVSDDGSFHMWDALHETNGKAERFIQTALREWAYGRAYHNSDQRSADDPLAPSL
jgi:WD40 repeat protein